MRSLLLITFSLLLFFSCKETKKSKGNLVYTGTCNTGENGEPQELTLIIHDSTLVLLPKKKDPTIMSNRDEEGNLKTSAIFGDLTVDFSNKDDVKGYIINQIVSMDTIANFDMETKKETIQVVESLTLDTVSTCTFTKGGSK